MKKINLAIVVGLLLLMAMWAAASQAGGGGEQNMSRTNDDYKLLTPENTISDLLAHPAFRGFGQHLLTRDGDVSNGGLRLRDARSLMPYHGYVNPGDVVRALNGMVVDARDGKKIFYDFYTDGQKKGDSSKGSTGLFFYRGKPGAPFAVVCPGGGFSYVGSFHEGFPYAMKLAEAGYNAFVLRYRVGDGGASAVEDLAATVSFIFANADSLGVSRKNYSLWGSSAGARMVAAIGSNGTAAYGGANLPGPATIVMAYTGYFAYTKNDPPTFVTVSENDPIANVSVVDRRVAAMKQAGIDVEYRRYKNAGHGFGLGTGTDAAGWIDHAIRFWGAHISN